MKSQKITLYLILVAIVLIALFLYFKALIETDNTSKNISIEKPLVKDSQNLVDEKNKLEKLYSLKINEPSDSIKQLNIALDSGGFGVSGISNEETVKFVHTTRDSTEDVIAKIQEVLENPYENYTFLNYFLKQCKLVDEKIERTKTAIDNNEAYSEVTFNFYYFLEGIKESGICNKYVGRSDPFYLYLKLARDGHGLAQFSLLDELNRAVDRGTIDIKIYPENYIALRDEAIMYLTKLSRKGLYHASMKLAVAYRGSYVPKNLLLVYYYGSLTERQNKKEYEDFFQLDELYNKLTDKQKAIADRMTKNL